MDVALWSEGAVSYSELKTMSPLETRRVVKRLNSYLKSRAKAGR